MIIYNGLLSEFESDIDDGVLATKLSDALKEKMGRTTPFSEFSSWHNSLESMYIVLSNSNVPKDAGIAIEYNIPYTGKRVDMIVSGTDSEGTGSAVVIELKQWTVTESVEEKDGIIKTILGGFMNETVHPSFQAWSYVQVINDYNMCVQDGLLNLRPCAYLHNYNIQENDPLTNPVYNYYMTEAPLFGARDRTELRKFIEKYIRHGDRKNVIEMIDGGRLRPSKSLQDCIVSLVTGNREFVMIDSQKVVYEEILRQATASRSDSFKRVIIVEGGPGTGKSVLAINLLAELTSDDDIVAYVTKNSAPRNVYHKKLTEGKYNLSRSVTSVKNMFKGSGSFTKSDKNDFDVLVVDESHRLMEKSGMFKNKGENQIKEIINASKLSVFFIDESQRVTLDDVGTIENIEHFAKLANARVKKMELDSQFRCDGSDGYIAWLDDLLGIRETAHFDTVDDFNYDIRLFDNPLELQRAIEEKNRKVNKSRMVAGYCWNWASDKKNDPGHWDIKIDEFDFGMSWNLGSTNTWAIDEESVNEIGCIHTCQGLEFDYVGVIIGDDMRLENGQIVTDRTKRAKTDQSLRGLVKKYPNPDEADAVADRIIRNTYRTLMTRGMMGCYIYCTDEPLQEYFRTRIERFNSSVQ